MKNCRHCRSTWRCASGQLGLDQLEMYDLYTPIVPECSMPMTYEEAKALVKEASSSRWASGMAGCSTRRMTTTGSMYMRARAKRPARSPGAYTACTRLYC